MRNLADFRQFATLVSALAALVAAGSACINSRGVNSNSLTASNTSSNTVTGTSGASGPTGNSGGPSYVINNIVIAGGGGTPSTSIYLDSTKSVGALTDNCSMGAGGNNQNTLPCVCSFQWQEINPTTGSNVTIPRSVTTPLTNVQPDIATCNAPDVYTKEIQNGTSIRITIQPGTGNSNTFQCSLYTYTKNTTTPTGSFQDAQGHFFDNVLHYSCYEQFKRGIQITSKTDTQSQAHTGEQITFPSATKFCLQNFSAGGAAGGGGGAGAQNNGCPSLTADYSAQANYYNLYIRDSERGNINIGNDRYTCPTVREALHPISSVGAQGQYWPLDTSFALSLGPTTDFNVGVDAITKVSLGAGDPTSQNSSCFGAAADAGGGGGGGNVSSLVQSCLGFAAKPNTDGSCPYFRDSFGQIRFTYRLRRFLVVYPPIFDTDGNSIQDLGQPTDTIYVLDRPVNVVGGDPLKPFTMLGPKPCPFSYYDRRNVTSTVLAPRLPSYVDTLSPIWTGKNVDGTELPNVDSGTSTLAGSPLSCSAAVPILDATRHFISLFTVNINSTNPDHRHVYIRPIQAWAPHYEEDTAFQACAPQSYPNIKDPPLHFARDPVTGNVAYCAEDGPTQNDNFPSIAANWAAINYGLSPPPACPGGLAAFCADLPSLPTFTSHVALHSASAQCTASMPTQNSTSAPLLATATNAMHVGQLNTCDRTVVNTTAAWPYFPLLGHAGGPVAAGSPGVAGDIENALIRDNSYRCSITWDNQQAKSANRLTPSQGCCGPNVFVYTANKSQACAGGGVSNFYCDAHLEPDVSCLVPQY